MAIMKVTREKAEENRQQVIEASSRLFRERGFDGVGVSTLMQAAGLTHGGFYKQFESKDDLIAMATQAAIDQSRSRMSAVVGKDKRASFETAIRHYLSDQHCNAVADGCAFAALGPDAARRGAEVRRVMQRGVEDQLALLESVIEAKDDASSRETAIATLSTMVGALILARAVEDPALSSDILQAAAKSLLSQ